MAWSARVESYTFTAGQASRRLVSAQTLAGSGASVVVAAPVAPPGAAGGVERRSLVRVVALSGVCVFALGPSPTPGPVAGTRLQAGQETSLETQDGDVVAFAEDADAMVGAPAGENHLGEVGGASAVAAASFARPSNATAYAAGQLVANSVVAAQVTALALSAARRPGGTGLVRRVRLSSSNPGAVGASLRAHLFRSAPTSGVGDGGAFASAVNGVAAVHVGSCDVTLDRAFSDGAKGMGAPTVGSEIVFDTAPGATSLYALLEARSAYTPVAAEVLTLALEVLRD